jgi:hypothetical protein
MEALYRKVHHKAFPLRGRWHGLRDFEEVA